MGEAQWLQVRDGGARRRREDSSCSPSLFGGGKDGGGEGEGGGDEKALRVLALHCAITQAVNPCKSPK